MQCQSIYRLLCLILYFISNGSCSGVINDCFFIGNITDSVELVCDASKPAYQQSDCFLRLFSLDATFSNHRANVKRLKTGRCTSSSLRRRFFESFTNLRSIDISYFGVEILSDLQLKYLQTLNASHNILTTIRAANLRYMPDIRNIDLAFNQISSFEYGTFSRLRELRSLNLSFNSIEIFEHDPFRNNKKLEILQLQNNPIKRVDSSVFSLLKRSVFVSVSWDKVTAIDTSCLGTALRINFSHDNVIFFGVLYRPDDLKCPGNVFKNLTHFNASGNHLENTPKIIELLGSSINTLDLASNFIGNVCLNSVNGCSVNPSRFVDLQFLNLSQTNLTHFSVDALRGMKKLRILDLSFNRLQSLDFGSVILTDLNTLLLDGNQLAVINWASQLNLPKLTFLSVAKNDFSCEMLDKFEMLPNLHLSIDSSTQRNSVDCRKRLKSNERSTEKVIIFVKTERGQQREKDSGQGKVDIDESIEMNGQSKLNRDGSKNIAFGQTNADDEKEDEGTLTDSTETIETIDDAMQTENNETTQIITTTKNTEASKNRTAQNMETTTDINFHFDDKNEGDFDLNEVHSSSVFTEVTTTDSSTSPTDSKLHSTFDTTTNPAINNATFRMNYTKSLIYKRKYRLSFKIIPSANVTAYLLAAFLVASIAYLIVGLKCARRFKRNLRGTSNRLHIPYKLDQLNDSRNHIEMIEMIDFRQCDVDRIDEQCEFE